MTDVMNSMDKSENHYDENYSHTREYIPYMFHLYKILEQNRIYVARTVVAPGEDGHKE